jgi:hypothetical protein
MKTLANPPSVLAGCLGVLLSAACAQDTEESFAGQWLLELDVPPADVYAHLELEHADGSWAGYVEGGPVTVGIDGDRLEVVIDSRDTAGFVFERRLVGRLSGDLVSGDLTVVGNAESAENGSTWTARRVLPDSGPVPEPSPVDLAGTWVPIAGADIRKYSMDLTPAAAAWVADYLPMDLPNERCVSSGIVAMIAWAAYPSEWLVDTDRITIIYEVGSEVRRVYLDGREPLDHYPHSPMGFSTGRWEGSTLVIETQRLSPTVRDFRGEPISENARFVERYTLSEEGTTLSAVMMLHDPENYRRPAIRRRMWRRDSDAVIFPYECDPDSFFRQLYEEDKMDDYIDRADRRR